MDDAPPSAPARLLAEVETSTLWVGLLVLLGGLLLAVLIRPVLEQVILWRGRSPSAALVFSRVSRWVVGFFAVALAITVVFPSVQPVDLLGGIGVISIAAGIAFQTVLGNMFAGLVLLSREVINVGDQVGVGEVRGTVTRMALTTTTVRTFDGREVLIPNSTMHSSIVVVQTSYESVRTSVHVDLDERVDVHQATRVALAAMATSPAVAPAPPPEALLVAVGTGTLRMELRFWSGARQLETLEAQDAVIRAVIDAFHANGVVTGTQTHVIEAAPSLERALESVRVLPESLAMSSDDDRGPVQGARRPTYSSDSE